MQRKFITLLICVNLFGCATLADPKVSSSVGTLVATGTGNPLVGACAEAVCTIIGKLSAPATTQSAPR